MSSKDGKIFEENIKKSADKQDIYCERIKDSASSFGQDSDFTKYTVKNPYDFIFFNDRCYFPSELKSTSMSSISIQRTNKDKSAGKMIKYHQIKGLKKGIDYDFIYPSFLLDFRVTNNTYYLSIEDFLRFLKESDKKSINEKDVVKYGGIIINKKLLIKNYEYNLKEIFNSNIINKLEGEK